MQRQLKLNVDLNNKAVIASGDDSFFIGDTNRIIVETDPVGDYLVLISALIPGGNVLCSKAEKQSDGTYVLKNLDAFLTKSGKVKAQVEVYKDAAAALTINEFEFNSNIKYSQSPATYSPDVKSLAEFYAALNVLKSINLQEIRDAVEIIEGLDIQKLEQIQTMADELTAVLNNAKGQSEELTALITETNALIADIQNKLQSGAFNGKDGKDGAPGTDGKDGAVGPQGPAGPRGFQGEKGLTGEQGPVGKTGPVGPTGPEGKQGPRGEQGLPGEKGEPGAKGDPGTNGQDGAPGAAGADGFTPTIELTEELEGTRITVNNKDGSQTSVVVAGRDGKDGAQGPAGPAGEQGLTGEQGPAGEPGPAGATGPKGDPYTLTAEDKNTIVNAVASEFTQPILTMLE